MKPDANKIDTFTDVYLIMPNMDTTLGKIIRSKQRLKNKHYSCLLYQILRGLKYIHSRGIIHCNLKPKHILINKRDGSVKIKHFISAKFINHNHNINDGVDHDHDTTNTNTNTNFNQPGPGLIFRWYHSPERICNDDHDNNCHNMNINVCDEKIDIWSVGCIFGELMTRRPIFPGLNYLDQLKRIFEILGTPKDLSWIKTPQAKKWVQKLKPQCGKNLTKVFPNATPSGLYLLQKLLVFDPRKRISANDCLKHEYFNQCELRCPEKEIEGDPIDFGGGFENICKTKFGVRRKWILIYCNSRLAFNNCGFVW